MRFSTSQTIDKRQKIDKDKIVILRIRLCRGNQRDTSSEGTRRDFTQDFATPFRPVGYLIFKHLQKRLRPYGNVLTG